MTRGVVSIRVTSLRGVNALSALLGGIPEEMYAAITIAGRFLGRTPIFSPLDGDVDLGDLFTEVVVRQTEAPVDILVQYFRLPRPDPDVPGTSPITTLLWSRSFELPFPWRRGAQTIGELPGIDIDVSTRLVPVAGREVLAPRTIEMRVQRATVGIPDVVTAHFVDIEGLNELATLFPKDGERRTMPAREGYASHDHMGRVFISHDRAGFRVRAGQSIRPRAVIDVASPFPPDPSVAVTMKWRIIDVDDPSDDLFEVASPFRGYLDPKDHTEIDGGPYGSPQGPRGHDNEGKPSADPPWEEVDGSPLLTSTSSTAVTVAAAVDASRMQFQTEVVLHCPSSAGDRFILEIEASVGGFASFIARTGVITMWQRVDLQPIVLGTVKPINLAPLIHCYAHAYFQVDVAAPVFRGDLDDLIAYTSDGLATEQLFDFIDLHAGEPGWFTIIFYRQYYRPDERDGTSVKVYQPDGTADAFGANLARGAFPPAYAGDTDSGPVACYFEIDYVVPLLSALQDVEISILQPPVDRDTFFVSAVEVLDGKTRLWIEPDTLAPRFVAGAGAFADVDLASYCIFPSFHRLVADAAPVGRGYGLDDGPFAIRIEGKVPKEGDPVGGGIAGICGSRWIGGAQYFSNFLFVNSPEIYASLEQLANTASHELCHALGFPHRCGYQSAIEGQCVMQYEGDWNFTDGTFHGLRPGYLRGHATFCPRHLREIRRTILENHPAYRWAWT